MVLEEGKRWSMISKKLMNRSEHSVKNRFNSLLHRRVHRSRFESKAREEEKVIKKYVHKIEILLEKEKMKENENLQEKQGQDEGIEEKR